MSASNTMWSRMILSGVLSLLAAVILVPSAAHAAVGYALSSSQVSTVNEWGTCLVVSNNSGNGLFVPTNTSAEWSAFYNHLPSGVTTGSCNCPASGACGATANGGTCTSYTSSAVTSPTLCSSVAVSSTCSNGSWTTAPAAYGSCTQNYRSCSASGACGATANGGSCTTYSTGSVSYPSSCPSGTTSVCNDGTWSPSPYANSSCSVTYTYSWSYGSWGSCSASCGGGTQTRSATCVRSDGAVVADAYCGAADTSQSCNTQNCGCSASGACGATADGGTCVTYSTDAVTYPSGCPLGQSSTCNNGTWNPSPYSYGSCTVYHNYSWQTGSWGSCSAQCGGTQTRSVWCERDDGVQEDGGICLTTTPPPSSQSCNGDGTSCSACNGAGCNYGSCSGTSCTAQMPYFCWSSPGGCIYGTTAGSAPGTNVCQASDPSYYGTSCTSAPNSCGQTNTGTYNCADQCSATTPPDSSCPVYGCTNSNAFNYNSSANTDDGSCHYNGCYDLSVDVYYGGAQNCWDGYSGDYSTTETETCSGISGCNSDANSWSSSIGVCDSYPMGSDSGKVTAVGSPYSCN